LAKENLTNATGRALLVRSFSYKNGEQMLPIFVTVVSGQWKVVSPEERNLDWRVKSKAQRIKIESPAGMNSEIFTNVYTKKGSHSSLF